MYVLTVIFQTLPERCFSVQFLTDILITLQERFFFSVCFNDYIENVTGTLFF